MALFILNPGVQPLGEFDVLDTDLSSVLGGEVMVLDKISRIVTSTEKSAYDVRDGYVADEVSEDIKTATRVVARIADGYSDVFLDTTKGSIKVEPRKVFYLSDDGSANYGVLFGSVVGSIVGLTTTGGTQLGPSSISGSGKVTLWDKPGKYAISYDALATDLNPAAGNLNDTPLPGALLYREHDTGKLTVNGITEDVVAAFMDLRTNGTLVTTPAALVGSAPVLDRITIQYFGASF